MNKTCNSVSLKIIELLCSFSLVFGVIYAPFRISAFAAEKHTVYFKQSEIVQTFQNYSYDTTNPLLFGKTVSIVKGGGVGHGDNAVAKFTLDGDAIYSQYGDSITYWASRSGSGGHVIKLGEVADGNVYKVSFWYKGDANANVNSIIRLQSANPNDCWEFSKTNSTTTTVTPSTTEWKKEEYLYHCALANSEATGLFIRFNALGKADNLEKLAIAYIDDVVIEKINKPYILFDSLDGKTPQIVEGKAGETIKAPEGAKKEGYNFVGWYTDKEFTKKFTNTVFTENMGITVYAKYELSTGLSESFNNYPYSTTNTSTFGATVGIVKGSGVGHGDNAAAKFTLDGDVVCGYNANGSVEYWASCAGKDIGGHVIKIGNVEDGEVYKVSFWYKGDTKANVNSLISIQTANPNDCRTYDKTFNDVYATVTPDTKEWKKLEFIYDCALKDPRGSGLFIKFNSLGKTGDLQQLAIAYIDDIVVQKIEKPFVFFNFKNGKQGAVVQGKEGQAVKFPDAPKLVGMKFVGWYSDENLTKKFTNTVFTHGMGAIVYAKYDYADSFTVSFENVGVNRGKEDDNLFYGGGMGAVEKIGCQNSGGLLFDRTKATSTTSTNALFEGGNQLVVSSEHKYYVTFKYCVTQQQKDNGYLYFRAASIGNAKVSKSGIVSIDYPIGETTEVGRWYTAKIILDTSKIYVNKENPKQHAAIYMCYRGGGGRVVIDDITFKKLPKGHQAYVVDNGGADSVPCYITGKIGTSFRSHLPQNPQFENHIFKNYFMYDKSNNQVVLQDKDMVFTEESLTLATNWVRLHTVQDFENYTSLMYAYQSYYPADFDYELYNVKAQGNFEYNATSGNYSIHRRGTTPYFESIQILSEDLKICSDEKYKVTMKVKIGKHFHTDGAIKVVGCKSPIYAWANLGLFHPIAVIADIADGEWHEVSYTFSSAERYLSVQTPGYVEVFIDDVVIDRVDPETPVSTPPEYKEYVEVLRDKSGNIIEGDAKSKSLISCFNVVTVIIIGVVLVAAVFIALFLTKKRK